ncbi:MAG: AbrB/MazE/SpoVT family DNA-binding domain-containing protein [Armatimonadota bacterium]
MGIIYKNGRITIPAEMRKQLGLHPGSVVTFEVNENNEVILKPAKATNDKPAP